MFYTLNTFFEIHSDNLREGPGSFQSTKRAFSLLNRLPDKPNILDVGCGPGQQTLDLAKLSNGTINAIDNHQPFLNALIVKRQKLDLDHRIDVLNGDMFNLGIWNSTFDLIWSEGAIYIIGFERGLIEWKPFLKLNGYIAVSHICWLKENPPKELFNFWNSEYPDITTVQVNLEIINTCGYKIIDHFTLPESDWLENYYKPIEKKLDNMQQLYKNDRTAMEVINMELSEIDLYKEYSDYYGYEFFIMQNV